MPYRKIKLVKNEYYHIYNRGVDGMRLFRTRKDYKRIIDTLNYYVYADIPIRFSQYIQGYKNHLQAYNAIVESRTPDINVFAYCIMPNHFHLLLRSEKDGFISKYLRLTQNSYAKYFNLKYKRKGPLLENRFYNVLISSDAQYKYLKDYIHNNPVRKKLVHTPELWEFSSASTFTPGVHVHTRCES